MRIEPFAFRLPKDGSLDPHFGGTRAFWNSLILPTKANGYSPAVRSVVRKQPGANRGIRFIFYASAKEYFQQLAEENQPA